MSAVRELRTQRRKPYRHKFTEQHVLIVAGMHGDEPSGPHIASIFQRNREVIRRRFNLTLDIIPIVNWLGFIEGVRENGDGKDLNRCFFAESDPSTEPTEVQLLKAFFDKVIDPYKLFISLHEDPERKEFYLYDAGEETGLDTPLIQTIFKIVERFHIKLWDGSDDPDDPKLDFRIRRGYHQTTLAQLKKTEPTGLLEDYLLLTRKTKRVILLELPGKLALSAKIELGTGIIGAIIKQALKK